MDGATDPYCHSMYVFHVCSVLRQGKAREGKKGRNRNPSSCVANPASYPYPVSLDTVCIVYESSVWCSGVKLRLGKRKDPTCSSLQFSLDYTGFETKLSFSRTNSKPYCPKHSVCRISIEYFGPVHQLLILYIHPTLTWQPLLLVISLH